MKLSFPPALENLELIHQGKTRDTFATNEPHLLLVVATDRISTHNVVHRSWVPLKGEVLTALSVFWFLEIFEAAQISHHLVACGGKILDYLPGNRKDYPDDLRFRAIVVRKLDMIKVEWIFRAYLTGSLHEKSYAKGLPNLYGIDLPPGLSRMARFDPPIFTPTEKSTTDAELNSAEIEEEYPEAVRLGRQAFNLGRAVLNLSDVELIDTKFEVGFDQDHRLVMADEVLTPDSSRFARLDEIMVGDDPPWLDKEIARQAAKRVWRGGKKIPLQFPDHVIGHLMARYQELFVMATGRTLKEFQQEHLG